MSLRAMLAITWTLLGAAFVAASSSAAADTPYPAVVRGGSVYLRSGPGENYYATEILRQGDRLTVMRPGPRGWLAVRPTRESFNWISARYVREVPDGMVEVTGDRVALRVGSDLTTSRDIWQLTLRRGEKLEVIDRVKNGSGDWYRVSPPQGEVRWVSAAHIEQTGPPEQQRPASVSPVSAPLLQPAAAGPAVPPDTQREPSQLPLSSARSASLFRRLDQIEQQLHELDQREAALRRGDRDHWASRAAFQEPIPSPIPSGSMPSMAQPPAVPLTSPMMDPMMGPMLAPQGMTVTDPAWDPYCNDGIIDPLCGRPLPPRFVGWGATGVKAGDDRNIGEADLFIPLWQDEHTLFYGDLRGSADDLQNQEANGGLGLRSIVGEDLILGGYGFFDYRWSQTGNEFMGITLGAELKTYRWDLRGNLYLVEDEAQNVGPGVALTPTAVFANNTIVLVSGVAQQVERAYYGADFEVGALLATWGPCNRFELRAYGGGFFFDTDDSRFPRIAGPRARIDLTAFDLPFLGNGSRLSVGAECTWDDVRDSQVWGLARVQIPFNVFNSPALQTPFRRRMLDPVQRDIDIVTEVAETPPNVENTNYDENGQPVGLVTLVDAGTADKPGAVAGAGPNSTVIVDGSKGVVQTSATTFMQTGQTVRGAGFVVRGQETGLTATFGTRPTINNSNAALDTLVVADNTTVRDLDIVGGLNGITSDPTGGANNGNLAAFNDLNNSTITGNTVTGTSAAGGGIVFRDINPGSTVTGNMANANGGFGLVVRNVNAGGTVSNNTANGNGQDGIFVENNVNGAVSGNTANGNQGSGFFVGNDVNGTVSGNTATNNSGDGYQFTSVLAGGAFSNNTATENGFAADGTLLDATAQGFVFTSNAGTFFNNTATNNASDGYVFDNNAAIGQFAFNKAIGNGMSSGGTAGDATANGFSFNTNSGAFWFNTANNNVNNGFSDDDNTTFDNDATGIFIFNNANNNGNLGYNGTNNGAAINNGGGGNTNGNNMFP